METLIEKIKQAVGDAATIEQKDGVISVTHKKSSSRWKPEIGKIYFLFNDYGILTSCNWSGDSIDGYNLITGNVHRTKEEAKQWLKYKRTKFEILEEIERLNDGWVANWGDRSEAKYFPALVGTYWDVASYRRYKYPHGFYLKSYEACKALIEKFGDKLKVLFNPYI